MEIGLACVWIADLSKPGRRSFIEYLSPSEQSRAAKFRFPKDRDAYAAARGILRVLLGEYFHAPPETIEILATPSGKPYVRETLEGAELHFNLTHSGGLAAYAFALNHPLGIDAEILRSIPDLDGLAAKFFSREERDALRAAAPPERTKLFLQYWTRKEAYLKALGLGLQISPEEINAASVPVPAERPTPFAPRIQSAPNAWALMDFFPTEGSVAALAVRSSVERVVFKKFQL